MRMLERRSSLTPGERAVRGPESNIRIVVVTALRNPYPLIRNAMTDPLKVRKVGNSSGATCPKSLLEEISVEEEDELFAVREADESLRLTPYDPRFAEAVEDAWTFMDAHRNAVRELAK
jgi:putative addiction module antidote